MVFSRKNSDLSFFFEKNVRPSVRPSGGGEGVDIKKWHDFNGILCDLKGVLNGVFAQSISTPVRSRCLG